MTPIERHFINVLNRAIEAIHCCPKGEFQDIADDVIFHMEASKNAPVNGHWRETQSFAIDLDMASWGAYKADDPLKEVAQLGCLIAVQRLQGLRPDMMAKYTQTLDDWLDHDQILIGLAVSEATGVHPMSAEGAIREVGRYVMENN